jgi:hypothetical protein
MSKVRFTVNIGAGQEEDFSDDAAKALVDKGWAEATTPEDSREETSQEAAERASKRGTEKYEAVNRKDQVRAAARDLGDTGVPAGRRGAIQSGRADAEAARGEQASLSSEARKAAGGSTRPKSAAKANKAAARRK